MYAAIVFIVFNLIYGIWSSKRIILYGKEVSQIIQEKSYKKKLRIAIKLIQDKYFKKVKRLNDIEKCEENKPLLLEKCFICEINIANILLYPCGHTGFCKDCFIKD